jgi:hypothetical protein
MMSPTFLVMDNFYVNPDEVRKYALSLPFEKKGNYPGARTKVHSESDSLRMKGYFEELISRKINYWPTDENNTSFQYTTKDSMSWVHHDLTSWAAVLYLKPDAPLESGTAIYRHKESGISMWDPKDPLTDFNHDRSITTDLSKWEQVMSVGNVFNRLVMYRGEYYHRSIMAGFGDDQFNGRLFQTFFFDA